MSWLAKFLLTRISGPAVIWVLLGLVAANATTGWLLKKAWDTNARAVLQCENNALRDANAVNEETARQLIAAQKDRDEAIALRLSAERDAEIRIAATRRAMEIEHETQLADLEVATNEITDDEFFCASEPVAADQLARMRDAVATYNENRSGDSH